MKRDSIKKGIWLLLMVVVVVQSIVFGARFVQASEVEHRISNNLNDYNVFLTGYHSADSADIEGPLAVKKDSSFGKNLETYSYAAMFAENANTVGTPLDFGTQKTSLLIGGKIKNYSTSVQPVIESRTYEAEKIGWLGSSHADNTSYFEKVNVTDAQKKLISEDFNKKTFDKMEQEMISLSADMDTYSQSNEKVGDTLGEYSDGKLIQYDIYKSDKDDSVFILNIEPTVINGEKVAIIESFGFDYESIINNKNVTNIIVTSIDKNGNKADKIIFKGNYLANHNVSLTPLELVDPKAPEHAKKIVYNFSNATQITNFFDKAEYGSDIKPPTGIVNFDSGVESSGKDRFDKDYFSHYANGSSTNGSATYGGGPAVIGSVVSPKASVVFSSGNINGYLFATDLHQRNHMEVHNFWNQWFTKQKKGMISVIKQDSADKNIVLSGAEFDVLDQNKKKVDHIVTTDNGQGHTTVPLNFGTYTLIETKAPKGYELDDTPITVTINEDSSTNVGTVVVKNNLLPGEPIIPTLPGKGSISVIKQDAKDKTHLLSGAEFDVLDQNNKKVDHIITSTNGQGHTTVPLEFGPHTLIETKAPEGYELDATPISVNVIEGKETNVTTIEIKNEPSIKNGLIHIVKQDSLDDTILLSGAEFDVLDSEDIVVDKIVTDKYGHGISNVPLAFGQYTLIETKAPEGYERDVTPIEVTLTEEDGGHVATFAVKNTLLPIQTEKGAIRVLKRELTNQNKFLSSAEFDVINSEGTVVDHIVTQENGYGQTSVPLEFGDYTLVETKAPKGYELDETPHHVVVEKGVETNTVTVTIDNRLLPGEPIIPELPGKGTIYIIKQDSANKQKRLAGAEFDVLSATGDVIEHVITQENGIGQTKVPLDFGVYTLVETKAPEGYELDKTPKTVKVEEGKNSNVVTITIDNRELPGEPVIPGLPGKGSLHVIKQDEYDHTLFLSGAEFDVMNAENKMVDHVVTDQSGHGQTTIPLDFGTYTLTETKAPEGYDLDKTPHIVNVKEGKESNITTIKVTNKRTKKYGSIHIIKRDEAHRQKFLSGAEFNVLNMNQDIVDHIVTDKTGHGQTTMPLEFGNYTLVETKAPEGYYLDETPIPVTLDENKKQGVITLDITNTLLPGEPIIPSLPGVGSLEIIKHDSVDKTKLLAGAEFDLVNKRGRIVDHLTTNETGYARTTEPLDFGDYRLFETKAPKGYELNKTPIKVRISEGEENNLTIKEIGNSLLPGEPIIPSLPGKGTIHITKHDSLIKAKRLSGAEFIVLDSKGNKVDRIVTGKDGEGHTTVPLEFGQYRLIETKAPEGYELDKTPILVEVVEGKESNVVMKDISNRLLPGEPIIPSLPGKGTIHITKHDSVDKTNVLSGAEFDVLDSKGNKVDHIVTGKDGEGHTTVPLEFGQYRLIETKAPEGYELDKTPILVEVVEGKESNIVKKDIFNRRLPGKPIIPSLPGKGTIHITKHDSVDKTKVLSGAEFDVLDSKGNKVDRIVTGKDGEGHTTVPLEFGQYRLIETKAPEGYELDKTPILVEVVEGKESNVVKKDIFNRRLPVIPTIPIIPGKPVEPTISNGKLLPKTGETVTHYVTVGLGLLSLLPVVWILKRK